MLKDEKLRNEMGRKASAAAVRGGIEKAQIPFGILN
jgi:hypothetical protein